VNMVNYRVQFEMRVCESVAMW